MTCGQVRVVDKSNYIPNKLHLSKNEIALKTEEEEELKNIIIDDTFDTYDAADIRDHESISNTIDNSIISTGDRYKNVDDSMFETYDFMDNPEAIYYNVDNGKCLLSDEGS